MSISVTCPSGHKITASEKYAGKTVKCPKCSMPVKIPNVPESTPLEPQVTNAVAAVDPFSDLSANFGGTADGADPFGDLSNLPPATYPQAYPQAPYPVSGGAGYLPAAPSPAPTMSSGKKPSTASAKEQKPMLLIALIGGGAALLLGLVAIVGVMFIWMGSSDNSASSNSNSAAAAAKESELIRAYMIAEFHPEGIPEGPGSEEFRGMLKAIEDLTSPTAPVYLGYDSSMRAKMRNYMIAKGTSEGRAAYIALQITGGLKMLSQENGITADANGNYPIPEPASQRKQEILDAEIDESIGVGASSFAELEPLLKGLREKTLNAEEMELVFYLKAVLVRR